MRRGSSDKASERRHEKLRDSDPGSDVEDDAVLALLQRRAQKLLGTNGVDLEDMLENVADGKLRIEGKSDLETAQEVLRCVASIAKAHRALQKRTEEENAEDSEDEGMVFTMATSSSQESNVEDSASISTLNSKSAHPGSKSKSLPSSHARVYRKRKRSLGASIGNNRSSLAVESNSINEPKFLKSGAEDEDDDDTSLATIAKKASRRKSMFAKSSTLGLRRRATIDPHELNRLRELYNQVDKEPLTVMSQQTQEV